MSEVKCILSKYVDGCTKAKYKYMYIHNGQRIKEAFSYVPVCEKHFYNGGGLLQDILVKRMSKKDKEIYLKNI